ncbi:hypothetical protein BBJ41_11160 [Burkholderia stabilis]|uniref:DUF2239 family protein n=1 Tax=Burkholderia stabilis TaxID=95485 RepID=UPI000851CA4C|nr:DUF2239 family protein [Burkholderia stabilis]AOR68051.1 hypothetical protein BBJ41_11160 [Burkholderia stabilis]
MTSSTLLPSYTAFDGHRRLASGPLATVALAVRQAAGDAMAGTILIFDDATGRAIDLDLRGTADDIRARFAPPSGGASVALRKLVEDARRTHAAADRHRDAQTRAYHFMSAMAGDLPGFEEAARALYANDPARLAELVSGWPDDVRDHALALARGDLPPSAEDC